MPSLEPEAEPDMNRRDFLTTTAATMAGVGTLGPAFLFGRSPYLRAVRRHEEACRPDRLGLVWQGRSAAADPGRAGRGRLAVRRRQRDGVGGGGPGGDAAGLEEASADLQGLPRDAEGEGPRHRPHRHAGSLARAADDRGGRRPAPTSTCRSRSASTSPKGRRCWRRRAQHKRVVQVGTQRRSTPHLATARDRFIREGRLGTIAHVEIYCYYHMRTRENPPDIAPPATLD